MFLFNSNEWHTVIWYQEFLRNKNDLNTNTRFQILLSITNVLHTVIRLQERGASILAFTTLVNGLGAPTSNAGQGCLLWIKSATD